MSPACCRAACILFTAGCRAYGYVWIRIARPRRRLQLALWVVCSPNQEICATVARAFSNSIRAAAVEPRMRVPIQTMSRFRLSCGVRPGQLLDLPAERRRNLSPSICSWRSRSWALSSPLIMIWSREDSTPRTRALACEPYFFEKTDRYRTKMTVIRAQKPTQSLASSSLARSAVRPLRLEGVRFRIIKQRVTSPSRLLLQSNCKFSRPAMYLPLIWPRFAVARC